MSNSRRKALPTITRKESLNAHFEEPNTDIEKAMRRSFANSLAVQELGNSRNDMLPEGTQPISYQTPYGMAGPYHEDPTIARFEPYIAPTNRKDTVQRTHRSLMDANPAQHTHVASSGMFRELAEDNLRNEPTGVLPMPDGRHAHVGSAYDTSVFRDQIRHNVHDPLPLGTGGGISSSHARAGGVSNLETFEKQIRSDRQFQNADAMPSVNDMINLPALDTFTEEGMRADKRFETADAMPSVSNDINNVPGLDTFTEEGMRADRRFENTDAMPSVSNGMMNVPGLDTFTEEGMRADRRFEGGIGQTGATNEAPPLVPEITSVQVAIERNTAQARMRSRPNGSYDSGAQIQGEIKEVDKTVGARATSAEIDLPTTLSSQNQDVTDRTLIQRAPAVVVPIGRVMPQKVLSKYK